MITTAITSRGIANDRSHLKSLEEYAGEIADLIKKGDEARDKARLPHDHSAGAHLAEARLKMFHPKFVQWVEREFDISGSRRNADVPH